MLAIFYELAGAGRKHARALGSDVYRVYVGCGVITLFVWLLYPIAWGVCEGGNVIAPDSEAVFYGVLDLSVASRSSDHYELTFINLAAPSPSSQSFSLLVIGVSTLNAWVFASASLVILPSLVLTERRNTLQAVVLRLVVLLPTVLPLILTGQMVFNNAVFTLLIIPVRLYKPSAYPSKDDYSAWKINLDPLPFYDTNWIREMSLRLVEVVIGNGFVTRDTERIWVWELEREWM